MNNDSAIHEGTKLFHSYKRIVLIANSEDGLIGEEDSRQSPETLFVFFNDARRILTGRFDGDSVLVLRSGKQGPSVIRRDRLTAICSCFEPSRLKGIVNLRVHGAETPGSVRVHGGMPITFLDLCQYFDDRYPSGKIPSSGYAMATWLNEQLSETKIVLRGFSALRSGAWKVFDVHDWVFEQTTLRLMAASGAVSIAGAKSDTRSRMAALQAQFPQHDPAVLLAVQADVLSDRLEHANAFIDQLWSTTRFSRFLRRMIKRRR